MIRRINFFGGPGAGKSTTSAFVFQALKRDGINVEYVPEYVKKWTYYKRKPESFDQVYLFGKQIHNEDTALREFDCVVCDSPVVLAPIYAQIYGHTYYEALMDIALKFEERYPSVNILLRRGKKKYDPKGRYQDEHAAIEIDNIIYCNLKGYKIPHKVLSFDDEDSIYSYVKKAIKAKTP